MRKGFLLPVVLSALVLAACQRDQSVHAGNDTYQPLPAPVAKKPVTTDIHGELLRVDIKKGDFVVRVENGMEQTFKFDAKTAVFGLQGPAQVRSLVGREGSELIVQWQADDGLKAATRVDVTQPATNNHRHRRSS